MKYLLDTSICVFCLSRKLDLNEFIKTKGRENLFISEITVAELRFGAENSDDPEQSHAALDLFLDKLSVIPMYGAIRRYAKEKMRLNKAGTPINDDFDLLIGVTAVENKVTLVTDNVKHFKPINGIVIENWYKDIKK